MGFADIAGLEEAKREIALRMIWPDQFPEQAAAYEIRRDGGLLLYGPPGTGKTMLAKAVANELNAAFFHIRPADVISNQVGEAEGNIARLFEQVRAEPKAVLFLDEVESLVPRRARNNSSIMARVVSQILSEVDGLNEGPRGNRLLLLGATNEPDMIDPAMLRPGRFDRRVFVGPPTAEARRQLLRAALDRRPRAHDIDLDWLVDETDGMTGAEINELVNRAADEAFVQTIQSGTPQPLSEVSITARLCETRQSMASRPFAPVRSPR